MIWISIKRVIRAGFINFWRNGFVSFSSIMVVTMTLFVFTSLIFLSLLTNAYLNQVKDKVDINVYFTTTAPEKDILALKKTIESLEQVARTEYVSREDALKNFKLKHQDDEPTLQGLEELDDNPLGAVLNIKAKQPSQYDSIAKFLDSKDALSKDGSNIIESVNFHKNKQIIDRLNKIVDSATRLGIGLVIFFVLISIVITFNTIRIIIFTSRDEISVMKLVGASNRYIRWPFVVSGIMYGVISAVVTLAVFYPILYYVNKLLASFSPGLNLLTYYLNNFGQIFLIIAGSGILLGAVSSYLAVRRYLKI
ncbi:ABC transporter permease [Patescibacteria group bacterium]|nr:MAG: ABC transporter permease [Patescibacteria group bacterium]